MRILFIGDVVAKPGRTAVLDRIQDLREQHAISLAIMNAENLAGGFSITPSLGEQLFASGIDVMTSGNHIFDKKEAIPYIQKQPRLLRPANYPPGTPGSPSRLNCSVKSNRPFNPVLSITGLPTICWSMATRFPIVTDAPCAVIP